MNEREKSKQREGPEIEAQFSARAGRRIDCPEQLTLTSVLLKRERGGKEEIPDVP